MQHTKEMIKDIITSIIPTSKFSPFINPVIMIVITTRHTSIGNSKMNSPQSLFFDSLEMKYLKSETRISKTTDNQNA